MKQTAVEWLEDKIQSDMTFMEILGLINQAKEMEKEQIIESYCQGCADIINNEDIFPRETSEQYYKQTYESNT